MTTYYDTLSTLSDAELSDLENRADSTEAQGRGEVRTGIVLIVFTFLIIFFQATVPPYISNDFQMLVSIILVCMGIIFLLAGGITIALGVGRKSKAQDLKSTVALARKRKRAAADPAAPWAQGGEQG